MCSAKSSTRNQKRKKYIYIKEETKTTFQARYSHYLCLKFPKTLTIHPSTHPDFHYISYPVAVLQSTFHKNCSSFCVSEMFAELIKNFKVITANTSWLMFLNEIIFSES